MYVCLCYLCANSCHSPFVLDVLVDGPGDGQTDEGVVPAGDEHEGQAQRHAEQRQRPEIHRGGRLFVCHSKRRGGGGWRKITRETVIRGRIFLHILKMLKNIFLNSFFFKFFFFF